MTAGVAACTGTHALLFQAKDVAENTLVMTLDALDLSLYSSSLRCSFSPSFTTSTFQPA